MKHIILVLFILIGYPCFAQKKISGFIKDASTKESLIGANVFDLQSKNGSISNQAGFFSLIASSETDLRISFTGYETIYLSTQNIGDSLVEILLKPGENTLSAVEIISDYRPSFHTAKLNISEIVGMPSITGKPDVLKALQLLPGMRSQGEASSVILVRGGGSGENLYLLDNTPLIHVHHIGGYMSVFNSDMINDVTIYKGGFPAKYGEKLSSIVNIAQKSGNQSGFTGSLSVGITDISLSLEGPLPLKNSSFILCARKTFIDLYYLLATGLSGQTNAFLMYGFHDVNAKFSWAPNQRNTIAVNLYQGDDYLQLFGKKPKAKEGSFRNGNIWGNVLGSINWNHIFPSDIILRNTLSFTNYRLQDVIKLNYTAAQNKDGLENVSQKLRSSMQDISLRSDAAYTINKVWALDFGLKLSYLRFKPMWVVHSSQNISMTNELINALESAVYISTQIKPLRFLDIDIGLRGVNYVNNDILNFSVEPRLSLNFLVNSNHSFNLSAMRVSQNAQLLNNIGSLSGNEVFVPSGKGIPISFSNQFSFAYKAFFNKRMFELETSVYYKTLNRLTSYKDGYSYSMGDVYWRDKLVSGGNGKAMGAEFLFKKSTGRWTGFIAYTYSRSIRQFEEINKGNPYAYEYDSPHNLSLNLNFQISEKWNCGATWQYQTGLPYTPVIGRYISMDILGDGSTVPSEVLVYGDKNSARMKDYHRLDISFKRTVYTKKRGNRSEWTFGIYNVYARQNPYYYYYGYNPYGMNTSLVTDKYEPIKLYQMSMFSFIPNISYKYWFGVAAKKKKP